MKTITLEKLKTGIQTPNDLRGRRVATKKGTSDTASHAVIIRGVC